MPYRLEDLFKKQWVLEVPNHIVKHAIHYMFNDLIFFVKI